MIRPLKKVRRPFLLLEVLIAFMLIALCAIPLIGPHVAIYKDQQEFMDKIQLDHFVNQYYAELIEKLYRQNISWDTFANKTKTTIEREKIVSWDNRKLPYDGSYVFSVKKHKPDEEGDPKPFTVNLLELEFTFKPLKKNPDKDVKTKNLVYKYNIFVPRQLPGEVPEPEKDDKKETKKK